MPVSPQHVLTAIVVASGLGALVMCLLVLRYGFAAQPARHLRPLSRGILAGRRRPDATPSRVYNGSLPSAGTALERL